MGKVAHMWVWQYVETVSSAQLCCAPKKAIKDKVYWFLKQQGNFNLFYETWSMGAKHVGVHLFLL